MERSDSAKTPTRVRNMEAKRAYERARERARRRVTRIHQAEFRAFLAEEIAKEQLAAS